MPRPQRPWFRFYVEAVWDRKLRGLPADQRWVWVAVLAIARASPIAGHLMISVREPATVADVADAAAVPCRTAKAALEAFERLEMIDHDELLGALFVVAWDARQFETDDVTKRTRLHRTKANGWNAVDESLERSYDVPGNVRGGDVGTAPETETDTETDTGTYITSVLKTEQAKKNGRAS